MLENEADRKAIEDGLMGLRRHSRILSSYQIANLLIRRIQLDQADVILSEIKVNIKMFTRTTADHPSANAA